MIAYPPKDVAGMRVQDHFVRTVKAVLSDPEKYTAAAALGFHVRTTSPLEGYYRATLPRGRKKQLQNVHHATGVIGSAALGWTARLGRLRPEEKRRIREIGFRRKGLHSSSVITACG